MDKQEDERRKLSSKEKEFHMNDTESGNGSDMMMLATNCTNKQLVVQSLVHRPVGFFFHRKQLSSFILFLSVIIFLNLCPFQADFELEDVAKLAQQDRHLFLTATTTTTTTAAANGNNNNKDSNFSGLMNHVENCLRFMQLMFTNPIRFHKRETTRFMQAQAKVLGKVAKMWYIKKKIKKLSKKLKKHTIAVPVFTAIPIYEHSYYPSPYVTHVTHGGGGGGMHHAASSYVPAVAQLPSPLVTSQSQQQMLTSASNNHHMAYARVAAPPPLPPPQQQQHPQQNPMAAYQSMGGASNHQIINAYAPSPPLFVDEAGGLYGQYGNHYGRYDGGYHLW